MRVAAALALLLSVPALAGCLQPPVEPAATIDLPQGLLALVPEKVTGLDPAGRVEFGAGNDLAFLGDRAFVSTMNNGVHFIDISDPTAPFETATLPCKGKDIDAREIAGRIIVTVSWQSNPDDCPDASPTGGIRLIDATDPRNPIPLKQVPLRFGSHTHTPYGDTGLIYNSAYDLKNPFEHHRSEIIDVSNPDDPKVVAEFMFPQTSKSHGCHDILAEPWRNRAICAGITETMLWDTTDPLKPVVLDTLTDARISIHHSAATARDGKLLVLGDEYAGVLAPACHPAAGAPTGALWFYEMTDDAFGESLSFLAPPTGDAGKVCTAHNFNVVEGHDVLVAAFYSAGTLLVDFSDPTAPKVLDHQRQEGANTWATYYYRGAVFSGDAGRGFDAYLLK